MIQYPPPFPVIKRTHIDTSIKFLNNSQRGQDTDQYNEGNYLIYCIYVTNYHHHQNVLSNSRSYTANSGTQAVVLPKGRSFTAYSGAKVAVLLGMHRCGNFPLHSEPHCFSLASEQILKDMKRSQGPQRGGEESGFG